MAEKWTRLNLNPWEKLPEDQKRNYRQEQAIILAEKARTGKIVTNGKPLPSCF